MADYEFVREDGNEIEDPTRAKRQKTGDAAV